MNSPSPTSSTKPHLVLCIDDADIALRVRELLLSGEGYNVLLECDSTDLKPIVDPVLAMKKADALIIAYRCSSRRTFPSVDFGEGKLSIRVDGAARTSQLDSPHGDKDNSRRFI